MKNTTGCKRLLQVGIACITAFTLLAACGAQSGGGGGGSSSAGAAPASERYAVTTEAGEAWEEYDYGQEAVDEDLDRSLGDEANELYESLDELSSAGAVEPGRKIITTVDLRMESKEYDRSAQSIYDAIEEYKGYIEQSDITGSIGRGDDGLQAPVEGMLSGLSSRAGALSPTLANEDYSEYYTPVDRRRMFLTIRVPQENLSAFLEVVEAQGNVLSKQESAEDVTLDYVDVESHKKALLAEQARLLEMLERAENVEDMILLEERLSRVRYQLENYESRLRVYDNLISYSTVNLTLEEVIVYTEKPKEVIPDPTVGQRIAMGMRGTLSDISNYWTNLFVSFMTNLIYIAAVVIAVMVLVLILRRQLRRHPGAWREDRRPEPPVGVERATDFSTTAASAPAEPDVSTAVPDQIPDEAVNGDSPDEDPKKKTVTTADSPRKAGPVGAFFRQCVQFLLERPRAPYTGFYHTIRSLTLFHFFVFFARDMGSYLLYHYYGLPLALGYLFVISGTICTLLSLVSLPLTMFKLAQYAVLRLRAVPGRPLLRRVSWWAAALLLLCGAAWVRLLYIVF